MTTADDAQLEELRELVAGGKEATKKTGRRGMLKMAGAALAGAAGAAALRALPASAATGGNFILGSSNSANATTALTGPTADGNAGLSSSGAIALWGIGSDSTTAANEVGVLGTSSSGSGVDLAAGLIKSGSGSVGSGRLAMVGRTDIGAAAPGWNPAYNSNRTMHELVRGGDGSIWASRNDQSSASQARWKRINAVRVDTADGTGGVYKPFRVVDTRLTSRPAAGTTNNFTIAGTGTGAQAIPADAIAVIGNVTATGFTAAGYLSVFPFGVANPGTSTVNYSVGQTAIANSFVCGLGGGKLSVYVGAAASNIIIDITGYIQ